MDRVTAAATAAAALSLAYCCHVWDGVDASVEGDVEGAAAALRRRRPRKVLIIGSPGSGKSTVARALGDQTGLRVIHADTLYYQPHRDWEYRQEEAIAADIQRELQAACGVGQTEQVQPESGFEELTAMLDEKDEQPKSSINKRLL
jgi:MoxR-like ATPase